MKKKYIWNEKKYIKDESQHLSTKLNNIPLIPDAIKKANNRIKKNIRKDTKS